MLDGGAAVVLLDPVDLETVPPVVELGLQLGSAGFPWTGGKSDTESPGRIEVTRQGDRLFAFSFLARPWCCWLCMRRSPRTHPGIYLQRPPRPARAAAVQPQDKESAASTASISACCL